jgi:hypothetical protein
MSAIRFIYMDDTMPAASRQPLLAKTFVGRLRHRVAAESVRSSTPIR